MSNQKSRMLSHSVRGMDFQPAMTAGETHIDTNGQEQTNVSTEEAKEGARQKWFKRATPLLPKPYYSGNPLVSEVGENSWL